MADDISLSVFVDESGSDIIKDSDDRYYVSVGVVIPTEYFNDVNRKLDEISDKFNSGAPFKSKDIGRNICRRLDLLRMCSELDFQYFAIAIDKSKVDKESGYRYRNSFYKNVNKHLYGLIAKCAVGKIYFYIDSHGGNNFQESAKLYFEKHFDFYRTPVFNYLDDKDNRLIQLADIIAGSIRMILIGGTNERTIQIRQLIREKEILFQIWPFNYSSHLIGNVNTQEIDKRIEEVMLEKVNSFLIRNVESDDEYDLAIAKVLQRLLDAYYFGEGYIFSDQLRQIVNTGREKAFGEETFMSAIIGGIRKEGIIVAGTKNGYKLATTVNDISDYLNHDQQIIMPMLLKLNAARATIKASTGYDILSDEKHRDLKNVIDNYRDKDIFPYG